MTCPFNIGTNVRLKSNNAQTGTIVRNGALKTHSHVIQMTSGVVYENGTKQAFFGSSCCVLWEVDE